MNTEVLKLHIICSRTRSEDQFLYAKVQSIFVPSHFVCSVGGTAYVHHTFGKNQLQIIAHDKFHLVNEILLSSFTFSFK